MGGGGREGGREREKERERECQAGGIRHFLEFCDFVSCQTQMAKIDGDKGQGVAMIYDKVKPYKGSKIIKYYFFVGNKKIKGTQSTDARFPTNIDDEIVVEYEIGNPSNNRVLLNSAINRNKKYLIELFQSDTLVSPSISK